VIQSLLYRTTRNILFCLEAERAHHLGMSAIDVLEKIGLAGLVTPAPVDDPIEVMGIRFPNRIGLAAGLDKEAAHVDGLARLGFGFIEVGTLTPRPQPGNPKPRLFRLKRHDAIINRMGFNNPGIEQGLVNLGRRKWTGPIGINIGKNFDTPNDRAAEDYLLCLDSAYDHADYIAVNLSSPNTKGLRELQGGSSLDELVSALVDRRDALTRTSGRRVPLAVKLAPDLDDNALHAAGRQLVDLGVDAIIATNTTIARNTVIGHPLADESGGLSGRPLRQRATRCIEVLAAAVDGALPVIGVGGIFSGADAVEKINAGASLIQLYTGFIYRGPELVEEAAAAVAAIPR
jgi:dihydroorotate dehydrogenase